MIVHGSRLPCIIDLLLNVLYIGRDASTHLREEQPKDTLTVLPIKVIEVHFVSVGFVLLVRIIETTSSRGGLTICNVVNAILVKVRGWEVLWDTVQAPLLSLCTDLFTYFLFDLL